ISSSTGESLPCGRTFHSLNGAGITEPRLNRQDRNGLTRDELQAQKSPENPGFLLIASDRLKREFGAQKRRDRESIELPVNSAQGLLCQGIVTS
ncbi:hypothetical protein, partial [Mesorhizobium sp. M1A.F.Ca.IN.020.06.1.1]|uniref:hypothetical protein n=1 Tax=Mesorhizobium sp. M1A.F.Ca.IN.020.06.1.1 TaxID=2496765 RepID=UPI0019D4C609